jgi:hypothetical protein
MVSRKLTWSFFLVALLLFLPASIVGREAQGPPGLTTFEGWSRRCSLATLKGTYGYIEQGTIVAAFPGFPPPPLLLATSGALTYDGKGHLSGAGTTSLNGLIFPDTFAGTYTVNPDCTYSTQFTTSIGMVLHEAGTITGPGGAREIHSIDADAGMVASATDREAPREGCSLATFKGTYALFGQGTITGEIPGLPPPPFPVVHSGIFIADGAGNFSGLETTSIDGVIVPGTFTGTYTVNPDCTESAVITTSLGLVVHEAGTITGTDANQEIHKIVTDAGWVFADTAKKQ